VLVVKLLMVPMKRISWKISLMLTFVKPFPFTNKISFFYLPFLFTKTYFTFLTEFYYSFQVNSRKNLMGYRMTNIEIELYSLKFSFFLSVSALLLYWPVRSVTNNCHV